MAGFELPRPGDILKYHIRWNERSLQPYEEELTELWAQNGAEASIDFSVLGPMMVRFAVQPADAGSASVIAKLAPTYKAIFRKRDLKVYRSEGRILIDIPWQHDAVFLGDLLSSEEYLSSPGLPVGIGMNIYRESILDDLTDIPHLLVTGNNGSGLGEYLESLLVSALMKVTPDELDFALFSSPSVSFSRFHSLPYCKVVSSQRQMLTMLTDLEDEIDERYARFIERGCHNIYDFNEAGGIMRHRLFIISEYNMLSGAGRRSAERIIHKAAELGGSCGIHLIVASVTPQSLKNIVDLFPARVCLRVDTAADSVLMIGHKDAAQLTKRGALYYLDGHGNQPAFLQGGAISGREIRGVLDALGRNYADQKGPTIFDEIDDSDTEEDAEDREDREDRENREEKKEHQSFWQRLFS